MAEALTIRDVTVDDLIASRRADKMECFCGRSGCNRLEGRGSQGRTQIERLTCTTEARTFIRIWIGGYR